MMPISQISMVRVTSPIDLAKELMYFVTETPVILKVAIEKKPIITKRISTPLENTYEK
jgi:hypothetical protein